MDPQTYVVICLSETIGSRVMEPISASQWVQSTQKHPGHGANASQGEHKHKYTDIHHMGNSKKPGVPGSNPYRWDIRKWTQRNKLDPPGIRSDLLAYEAIVLPT